MSALPDDTLHTSRGCFGCGPENPSGLQLLDANPGVTEDGTVRLTWIPEEKHHGYPNVVHGAVVFAFFDELAAWCCSLESHSTMITTKAEISYRRPILVGESIVGEAKVTSVEGNRYVTECTAHDSDGDLKATATIEFLNPDPELLAGFNESN